MRRLRREDFACKLYWKGEKTGFGGVGIMMKLELVDSLLKVRRVSPRIICIGLRVEE